MENYLKTIGDVVARIAGDRAAVETEIAGLSLYCNEDVTEPSGCMFEPSICLVAQGAKRVLLGEDRYQYDPDHFLISSMYVPAFVQIVDATQGRPYLGLVLKLDLNEISKMMVEVGVPFAKPERTGRGMALGEVDGSLLDAFTRLVRLLDEPEDIPVLAPMVKKEILYRLLKGEQGVRLRQIASGGTQSRQIALAIEWLKDNFATPLSVDELAARVNMSTSTFHHHFRAMTALSPLQFQKQLRLQEARRLMLSEYADAATAAFYVGYESASQFSREYSRLFGAPPLRDISTLRKNWTGEQRPL